MVKEGFMEEGTPAGSERRAGMWVENRARVSVERREDQTPHDAVAAEL